MNTSVTSWNKKEGMKRAVIETANDGVFIKKKKKTAQAKGQMAPCSVGRKCVHMCEFHTPTEREH